MEGRDHQLWSINVLVGMAVAAGFLGFLLPHILWKLTMLRVEGQNIRQFFYGFVVLFVLFEIYMLGERGTLRSAREELFGLLVRSEASKEHFVVDPLTEVFSRSYLEQFLIGEVSRADRRGTKLTFLLIDVDDFKSVNARFGYLIGDRLLSRVGQLLRGTFRRSDLIARYGGDEFLVVMHDTTEAQAERAIERLMVRVDRWNPENAFAGYKLSFSCGLATYTKGTNLREALEAAHQTMLLHKASHSGFHV